MRRLIPTILIALLALTGGIWLGGHPDRLPRSVRTALVSENNAIVGEALGVLERRYYREVDGEKLRNAALEAAVKTLDDRFSAFLTPREMVAFQEATDARFEGIGVEVQKATNGLRIGRVYDGSPASKSGLRSGDMIVRADGKSLAGLSVGAASALIRGPEGTSVALEVARGGKVLRRKVARAQVRVPAVEREYRAKQRVGVVRLASFSTDAHDELESAIRRLQERGAKGIVLDLRGNPGGLVSEAQAVSSLFLDGEDVVSMRGRAVRTRTLQADSDPPFPKLHLVVLVDEFTASAAEIVGGALQDNGRAEVFGTRTYGKGVFQEIIQLDGGAALDITVGQYFTPSGRNLGGEGVKRGGGLRPDRRAVDDPATKRTDEALDIAAAAVAKAAQ